jgi:hypothetical protein
MACRGRATSSSVAARWANGSSSSSASAAWPIPGQATTTSSSVYRQGAGGAWLALITLFLTPYYWFLNVWFRRVRLTTTAEMFEDRFGKRFLGSLYASAQPSSSSSWASRAATWWRSRRSSRSWSRTPPAYTSVEAQKVANYHEFTGLRQQRASGTLPAGTGGALRRAEELLRPGRAAALRDLPPPADVLSGVNGAGGGLRHARRPQGLGRGGRGAGDPGDPDLGDHDSLRAWPSWAARPACTRRCRR